MQDINFFYPWLKILYSIDIEILYSIAIEICSNGQIGLLACTFSQIPMFYE